MKQRRLTQRGRGRIGTALLTIVIALFVLALAMVLVLTQLSIAIRTNRKQRAATAAFNVAESGAELAGLWLRKQPYPPAGTADINPFNGGSPVTLGESATEQGTYDVVVTPDPANPVTYLQKYKIVSVGVVRGETKTVETVLQQASFGRYAYFTDQERVASGGAIQWRTGDTVDGPAHSNNSNGTDFNITYTGSSPIFLDKLTAVSTNINYSPSAPADEATYKKIFKDGSLGFQLGVAYVPLPSTTDVQRNAAWGGSSGFPTTDGVYLRAGVNGGLYIRGDSALALSTNAAGDQVIKVTQGTKVTTLTLNRTTKAITTSGPMGTGSATSATSLGTGVIFSTGNITSLQGEIADNLVTNGVIATRSEFTIATDVNAGKDITITSNLTYHTRPDKTQDTSASVNLLAGTLGLVSRNTTIDANAPQNMEIDAVNLSGSENLTSGSFSVANYNSKTPTGTLKVIGGIIQKQRGAVGTFNSSTGAMTTGYEKRYSYDPRLATNPPPYFPTTGGYERLSWRLLPAN